MNSISDLLHQTGVEYNASNKPKVKNKLPPSVGKWCALVVGCQESIQEHNKTHKIDSGMSKEAETILTDYRKDIKTPSEVNAVQLHCESRYNHDQTSCILVLASVNDNAVVQAIRKVFEVVYSCTPEAGPAPPTKAERGSRRIMEKYSKKK